MKKTIVTIVIVVLMVALAGVLIHSHDSKNKSETTMSLTAGFTAKPAYAPAGQVAESFPKALVIGSAATPTASYAIQYATANQSTTTYDTTDKMATVYAQYMTYFSQNKYEVLNKSESSTIDTLYAVTSANGTSSDINVVIVPDGSKTKVTTSYLKK
jgi:hypothetical protein